MSLPMWESSARRDAVSDQRQPDDTYRTQSGRQFVVIATGRGTDAALVAFALPE